MQPNLLERPESPSVRCPIGIKPPEKTGQAVRNLSDEVKQNFKRATTLKRYYNSIFPKKNPAETQENPQKENSYLNFIRKLTAKNGPDPADYQILRDFYKNFYEDLRAGNLTKQQVLRILNEFGPALTLETLYGRCLLQDGGVGSYKRIVEIEEGYISRNPQVAKWDHHYQEGLEAPDAVRERLRVAVSEALQDFKTSQGIFCIKDLPSGSGSFGKLFYEKVQQVGADLARVDLHCCDLDRASIKYAKNQNPDIHPDKFHFVNLLKYEFGKLHKWTNEPKADFIYCAGFFDYLTNDQVIRLLGEFYKSLKNGGRAVVGNFNKDFPDKYVLYMHNWVLRDRSQKEMYEIAIQAKIPKNNIEFLNLKNSSTQILMSVGKTS